MGLQDLVIAKKVSEFEKELKDIKTIVQMNNELLCEIQDRIDNQSKVLYSILEELHHNR